MDIGFLTSTEKAEIDLHGLTISEAKAYLCSFLNSVDKKVKCVTVMHGYRNGTALKTEIQKKFKHKRVGGKQIGLNKGVTYLILK